MTLLSQTVIRGFKKMHEDEQFCDFTIHTADKKRVHIHKVYLLAAPQALKHQLTGGIDITHINSIQLNISLLKLDSLVQVLYHLAEYNSKLTNFFFPNSPQLSELMDVKMGCDSATLNGIQQEFKRMYESSEMCDYTVKTSDGVTFKVHKAYLAAVSQYFRSILKDPVDGVDVVDSCAQLHLVSSVGMKVVLQCIYYQPKIELTIENTQEVLSAASIFQVSYFIDQHSHLLFKNLTKVEDLIDLLHIPKSPELGISTLHFTCIDYMCANFFDSILKGHGSGKLEVDDMQLLLSSDEYQMIDPRLVFDMVNMWLQADMTTRSHYAVELMKHIKFPLMAAADLRYIHESVQFMRDIPECKELLIEAVKYRKLRMRVQFEAQTERTTLTGGKMSLVVISRKDAETYKYRVMFLDGEYEDAEVWYELPVKHKLFKGLLSSAIVINNFLMVNVMKLDE